MFCLCILWMSRLVSPQGGLMKQKKYWYLDLAIEIRCHINVCTQAKMLWMRLSAERVNGCQNKSVVQRFNGDQGRKNMLFFANICFFIGPHSGGPIKNSGLASYVKLTCTSGLSTDIFFFLCDFHLNFKCACWVLH